jgi:predicted phosphohydrolase
MYYIASDLHYSLDRQGDAATRRLAEAANRRATPDDVLCLAGDIGADQASIEACLKLFAAFPGAKCAVAGNHDIWSENGEDSWSRLERLSDIFRKHGFHALEDGPFVHQGWGICGTMGWYDYSFKDDIGIPDAAYRSKIYPDGDAMWGDALHVRWPYSDEEVNDRLARKLAADLASLEGQGKIFVAMHHLPLKSLLVHPRILVPRAWRFLNAFLGSEEYGRILKANPRVACVAAGHVHMARTKTVGNQLYLTVGSDYTSKQLVVYSDGTISFVNF